MRWVIGFLVVSMLLIAGCSEPNLAQRLLKGEMIECELESDESRLVVQYAHREKRISEAYSFGPPDILIVKDDVTFISSQGTSAGEVVERQAYEAIGCLWLVSDEVPDALDLNASATLDEFEEQTGASCRVTEYDAWFFELDGPSCTYAEILAKLQMAGS